MTHHFLTLSLSLSLTLILYHSRSLGTHKLTLRHELFQCDFRLHSKALIWQRHCAFVYHCSVRTHSSIQHTKGSVYPKQKRIKGLKWRWQLSMLFYLLWTFSVRTYTHIYSGIVVHSIVVTIFVWFKSQCEWMWLHWYFRTKSSLHQLLLLLLFYCYNMYCASHYNRTCIIKHRFYERSFHSKTATGHWINEKLNDLQINIQTKQTKQKYCII